jgi:3-methylcrotonyl-CoA carboxylase alpha subunit
LTKLAQDADFRNGAVDTGLIERKFDELTTPGDVPLSLATTALSVLKQRGVPEHSRQWPLGAGLDGLRMNAERRSTVTLFLDGDPVETPLPVANPWADEDFLAQGFVFEGEDAVVFSQGAAHVATLSSRPGAATGAAADGAILSPMPGRLIAVEVAAGDKVAAGQKLVTLEAMKMEHSLVAPFDGTVAELSAETGGQVSEGTLLVRVERDV